MLTTISRVVRGAVGFVNSRSLFGAQGKIAVEMSCQAINFSVICNEALLILGDRVIIQVMEIIKTITGRFFLFWMWR